MYLEARITGLTGSSSGIFKNLFQNEFDFVSRGFLGLLKINIILKVYPDVPGAQGDLVTWVISWRLEYTIICLKVCLILLLGGFESR